MRISYELISSERRVKKLPRPIRKTGSSYTKNYTFRTCAFFRSFVASLVDDVNQKAVENWGIIAVSLNSEALLNKIAGQDLVFNALSMSNIKKRTQKISSICDFFVAKKEGQFVLDALSNEQIEIISLTITEKGYYYNSDKKELDFENQNIIEDLENPEKPKTAVGFLVAGLRGRYLGGITPFTVLSCDNLPNNGAVVQKIILDFAQKLIPDFAKWISKRYVFHLLWLIGLRLQLKNKILLILLMNMVSMIPPSLFMKSVSSGLLKTTFLQQDQSLN